ncbi:MAG: tetratricopeptide repeat protein [Candidatus Coatesbacteria bacterium]
MTDWLGAAAAALKLAAVSLVLWEAAIRIGAAPAALFPRPPGGEPVRTGSDLLLGWSVWGLALLGLAASGLFQPVMLPASGLALLLGSRPARFRRVRLGDAFAALPPVTLAVAAAVALCLLPRLLAPVSNADALWYELGAPAQFLAAHRLLLDHVPNPFHLPVPVNLDFGIALALGDERLALWIVGSFFLGAGLVVAGLTEAAGRAAAGWLGLLFALSLHSVAFGLSVTKNDLPAAALVVAGLGLCRAGAPGLGYLLAGCGIAAKPVTAPLVLAWFLVHPTCRRRMTGALVLLAGPVLAWGVKTWLATGNPFYPVGWQVIPSLGWDARNEAANLAYHRSLCLPDALHLATFPRGLLTTIWGESPLLLAAIPWLLARRGTRRAAWAGLLGVVLTLAIGRMPRFGLAAAWWLAALASVELAALSRATMVRTAGVVLAGAALLRLAFDPVLPRVTVHLLAMSPADQRAEVWGTYGEVGSTLSAAAPGGIAVFGDLRTFGLPGRVIATGGIGETPLAWALSAESWGPDGVRKCARQLGVTWVVHNFVSGAYRASAALPFPWSDRQLVVYREFVRRYLRVAFAPSRVDHVQGGFYVYGLLPRPEPGPRLIYDLPGAEGLLAGAEALVRAGKSDDAAREVARLGRLLSDVGHLRNVMAFSFRSAGRWDGAYRMYAPGVQAGMVDDENWLGFAMAALETGRIDEALVAARRAAVLYPSRTPEIDQLTATLEHHAGERALREGKFAEAEAAYRACLESLNRLPRSVQLDESRLYATVKLADALARQGRRREAQDQLNEAALIRETALQTPEARAVLRRIGTEP